MDLNGSPKTVVTCTVPGEEGKTPELVFLSPGNATQIKRRLAALGATVR